MKYIQCKLIRKIEDGQEYTVTYIPKRIAIKNKIVRIKKDSKSSWSVGWTVKEVYENSIIDMPSNVKQEIKRHRKNTGDSIKK